MANSSVDILKNFYGHKLQQDNSRTARLYLNTVRGTDGTRTLPIAVGFSLPSSVSINHQYNGSTGNPNDVAHQINEFMTGAAKVVQGKYAEARNLILTAKGLKEFILPDNTILNKIIEGTEMTAESLYNKLQPYLSIFEQRNSSYEESRGYTNTDFNFQSSISIVLYPRLINDYDFSYKKYTYSYSEDTTTGRDKLISPAGQLRTLLRFLTGRTEYYEIDVKAEKQKAKDKNTSSTNGKTVYIPNPFLNGKGFALSTDYDLTRKDVNNKQDFVRYRRILPPNGYLPDPTSYNYGLEGTFRLVIGGLTKQADINREVGSNKDIYGSTTRSSTGSNFYDNLLISNVNITNSDTIMEMLSWDIDNDTYATEVTPEYITVNISFDHAYNKYDFNELYWALGLSSLTDMQATITNESQVLANEKTPEEQRKELRKEYEEQVKQSSTNDMQSNATQNVNKPVTPEVPQEPTTETPNESSGGN